MACGAAESGVGSDAVGMPPDGGGGVCTGRGLVAAGRNRALTPIGQRRAGPVAIGGPTPRARPRGRYPPGRRLSPRSGGAPIGGVQTTRDRDGDGGSPGESFQPGQTALPRPGVVDVGDERAEDMARPALSCGASAGRSGRPVVSGRACAGWCCRSPRRPARSAGHPRRHWGERRTMGARHAPPADDTRRRASRKRAGVASSGGRCARLQRQHRTGRSAAAGSEAAWAGTTPGQKGETGIDSRPLCATVSTAGCCWATNKATIRPFLRMLVSGWAG